MRRIGGGLLVLLGTGLIWAEARAQQAGNFVTGQQAATFLTGANHQNLTSTKIDTSRALRPSNVNGAFRTPAQPKAFGLGNIFPKISLGSWPPKLPQVSILQGKNPFQPNPIRGVNPFNPPKK